MEVIKSKIVKEIEKSKPAIIKFAQTLVKAKSENPYIPGESQKTNKPIEKQISKLIFRKLKKFGFNPKYVSALPNRPNVVCPLKNKRKPVLIFNGHMDTVVVGEKSKWKYPPFSGKIVGNKLYGRGAMDMKSSLAAMIFALKTLKKIAPTLKGNLILSMVADEKPGACSEIGTKYLLKQGLNGSACIVAEPGTEKIRVGMKGYYRFKIIAKGIAVSTGSGVWERKEKGENAVIKMAKILLALEELNLKKKKSEFHYCAIVEFRQSVITPGTLIKGGSGINIVPDYCEATVDIRLMPGQTKQAIKKQILNCIKKTAPQAQAKIQDLMFIPGMAISENEKIVKILAKNAKFILGKKPKIALSPSACDAHFFIKKGIPTICGFGPSGDNFHGTNEFVYTNSIIDACKIYALTAFDFLNNRH
jgi:acetylornithine deacetylase/succinyl-diaminopimelate desuccinylase family protein